MSEPKSSTSPDEDESEDERKARYSWLEGDIEFEDGDEELEE